MPVTAHKVTHRAPARAWTRESLLPWLVGLCLLMVPAAIAESYPRYLVSDIPPLCVAAAIGIKQISTLKGKGLAAIPVSVETSVRRILICRSSVYPLPLGAQSGFTAGLRAHPSAGAGSR
jgi:hypothetical protein